MLVTKMHTVFKLDGASRNHALKIRDFLDARQTGNNLPSPDIQESYRALGAASPVVRIKHYDEGIPRAYAALPMVCLHPFHDDQFYMYAPVGYNGTVFHPEGAIELSEQEAETVGQGLFAGGWSDPAYLMAPQDWGVVLPADYNTATSFHYTINSGIQTPDRRYVFLKPAADEKIISLYDDKSQLIGLFNKAGGKVDLTFSTYWIDGSLKTDLERPIIRDFPIGAVLVYRSDKPEDFTFCPAGFERMSAADFQWMDADMGDINLGIRPPPRPSIFNPRQDQLCSPSQL
ncbi:MAG: hypothetical protein WC043_03455 [Pseudobdellovibrionaceae bacterium]